VKRVEFASSGDALVTLSAKPNFRALGRKFGKKTSLAAAAIAALGNDELRAFQRGEPIAISVEGESHLLSADDLEILTTASGELLVQQAGGFVTAIDPLVTEELRMEGLARELISRVQRMRKEAGLAVSDRIRLWISGEADVLTAVAAHGEWIRSEVLATEIRTESDTFQDYLATQELDLDGVVANIALTRTE
jgi:isoleucyl-tRNA synthetase